MYARLITFEGADPSQRETVGARIRDEVLPRLKQIDGFAGYVALWNEEQRDAKALTFWDSREAAEAAEQQIAPTREQMISGFGMRLGDNRLYEVPVAELATTAGV